MEGMRKAMTFLARDPTNSIVLFDGLIGGALVTAAAQPSKGGYEIAYAVCSRKEPMISPAKGIALAVFRLLQDGLPHPQSFRIGVTGKGGISPKRMASLIQVHVCMDGVSGRVKFPNWYVKALHYSTNTVPLGPMPVDHYRERIVKDKTPIGNHLRKAYRKGRKVEKPNEKEKQNTVQ